MHVAGQLFVESFEARIAGELVDAADVFPDWSDRDVFGIVVDTGFGALGASLLMQLAIADFYASNPKRRHATPAYPEIHLFHLGGPHGDFAHFDFWPPRREVALPRDATPLALVEAINTRGVTRLVLPAGPLADDAALGVGPSTWAEKGAALERLRTCFLYEPDGEVEGADVELTTTDPRLFENIDGTLDAVSTVASIEERIAGTSAGDLTARDIDDMRFCEIARRRFQEVGADHHQRVKDHMAQRRARYDGGLHESYRRIQPDDALSRIAALASP